MSPGLIRALPKAIAARDAGAWSKHVADEFVAYASSRAPLARSSRIAAIEDRNDDGAVHVGEVKTMRLAVYGEGAVMVATGSQWPTARLSGGARFCETRWPLAHGGHGRKLT